MTLTEILLLVGLLVAAALISIGCFLWAIPLGFIVSGVLVAAIAVAMTIEVGE